MRRVGQTAEVERRGTRIASRIVGLAVSVWARKEPLAKTTVRQHDPPSLPCKIFLLHALALKCRASTPRCTLLFVIHMHVPPFSRTIFIYFPRWRYSAAAPKVSFSSILHLHWTPSPPNPPPQKKTPPKEIKTWQTHT